MPGSRILIIIPAVMDTEKKHITVVAGLIWRTDGYILISKRLPEGSQPNKWELPGGKVEAGESDQAALEREILEELGLNIFAGPEFNRVTHDYGDKIVTLIGLHVLYRGGEPRSLEVSEWKWIHPDEMLRHNFPPANAKLFSSNWMVPPSGWDVQQLSSNHLKDSKI